VDPGLDPPIVRDELVEPDEIEKIKF